MNIIEYFTQKLYNKNFKDYSETVFAFIRESISRKNDKLFNYFVQQFLNSTPNVFVNFKKFDQLLTKACIKRNIKIAKKIIDIIVEYNHEKEDFISSFYYVLIRNEIEELSQIKKETFSFIVENANNDKKYLFLNESYLEQAISNKNIRLIQYLINSNIFSKKALFFAVKSNDVDVVNVILKYNSKPSFINSISEKGTALCIAVENNNLSIVKSLLSISGIDPSLYDVSKKAPLILAINNIEILNEILNFYSKCDYIKNVWQFNKLLKKLLTKFQKEKEIGSFYININKYACGNNEKDMPKFIPILMRILEFKEIDPNCIGGNYTALLYACIKNRIDIVKILLNNEKTDVNLYSPENGNTPLIASIENNNFEIAKLPIENPKTDLNAKNFQDDIALTLAVNKKMENVVELLINNERFDLEEININKAFYISSGNISCLLSSIKTFDVNYQLNKMSQNLDIEKEQIKKYICATTLLDSVEKKDIEKVDLIINHPSFNKDNSQIINSIFANVEKRNYKIFKKLIKINNDDVNIYNSKKSSFLISQLLKRE